MIGRDKKSIRNYYGLIQSDLEDNDKKIINIPDPNTSDIVPNEQKDPVAVPYKNVNETYKKSHIIISYHRSKPKTYGNPIVYTNTKSKKYGNKSHSQKGRIMSFKFIKRYQKKKKPTIKN